MRRLHRALAALLLAAGLAACDEGAEVAVAPPPQEPGAADIGHFCGMNVVEHPGPKGQIFLEGRNEPLWFSSARDVLAFTLLPGEPKGITAIYVNDMAKVQDWDRPEPGTWVEAREALFVVGSDLRGGMGGLETVPFSDRTAAERFRERHGGTIFAFGEVPEDYVLGGGEGPSAPAVDSAPEGQMNGGHDGHARD